VIAAIDGIFGEADEPGRFTLMAVSRHDERA
jgi:hypothetical protein